MATATRTVTYNDQETALTGFLAWDDAARRPLPGLLLVYGGAGLDDHAKGQARRYAAHGFAVLACDMFGDGVQEVLAGHRPEFPGAEEPRHRDLAQHLRQQPGVVVRLSEQPRSAAVAGEQRPGYFALVLSPVPSSRPGAGC
jgi:dienelactone hydrolase